MVVDPGLDVPRDVRPLSAYQYRMSIHCNATGFDLVYLLLYIVGRVQVPTGIACKH